MKTVSLKDFSFVSEHGAQYERDFILSRGAVKIDEAETELTVAVVETAAEDLIRFLEGFHLPKKVHFARVKKADFASFVGTTTTVRSNQGPSKEHKGFALDAVEKDAPVINIINALCIDAIPLGASDIHIEAQEEAVEVRYRIDGVLHLVKKLEKSLFPQLSNRIKVMSSLNTLEKRLPQDGRMTVTVNGRAMDVRVSIVPITNGESIVLRLFRGNEEPLGLDDLGFSKDQLTELKKAAKLPYGLVIMTGPTGSGKTTTLHALLKTLDRVEKKIVTIEDPVEQYVPGVSQIQVNEAINLGFDSMLRRVLRQDPDIIMVGEIRDSATAEIALRSALTGHLILSTLHTNDSLAVIPRLVDMGIERYLIAATLRVVAAQRLVRKLCPYCAVERKADKEERAFLKRYGLPLSTVKGAVGCDTCGGSGYLGRTVIGEVFTIDGELEKCIEQNRPVEELRKAAEKRGAVNLTMHALSKCAAGITDLREIGKEGLL
jgi:general secretion pathway protein E/type IV pilus assembly protein PilB